MPWCLNGSLPRCASWVSSRCAAAVSASEEAGLRDMGQSSGKRVQYRPESGEDPGIRMGACPTYRADEAWRQAAIEAKEHAHIRCRAHGATLRPEFRFFWRVNQRIRNYAHAPT